MLGKFTLYALIGKEGKASAGGFSNIIKYMLFMFIVNGLQYTRTLIRNLRLAG